MMFGTFSQALAIELATGVIAQFVFSALGAYQKLRSNSQFIGVEQVQLMDEMARRTDKLLAHIQSTIHEQARFLRPRSERLLLRRGKLQFVATDAKRTGSPVAMQSGNNVYLCVSDNPPADVLFAIVIHELAHYMEASEEQQMGSNGHSIHGQKFKDDERWLMDQAAAIGVGSRASPVDKQYCGIRIPDPASAK